MTLSVCTLARGRADHLVNLVRGLNQSTTVPDELVVAVLQAERYALPETEFPIRQILLGEDGLALAAARNRAAAAARGDTLIMLDVDCIPAPHLIADYAAALACEPALYMGEVGYLPRGATAGGIDFARFREVAVRHSERPGPPVSGTRSCQDYRCFWSLNFAMPKTLFDEVGGFDERYDGYGGEDTDFGRMVAEAGIPLYWLKGAMAFHQYHPHHMPPVHHIDSVIANSARFATKWGEPTMKHWLRAFTLMGLTRPGKDGWVKLREPNADDLALTRQQEDAPYASSARVLELLEARAVAAPDMTCP